MTLAGQLAALESSGLIHLAATQPELEYLFRHVLVQDAAYASLVKADRRALHQAIGEALERMYPDRLASRDLAPRLGQHFYEGGDDAHALKYFSLAGDAAAQVYANAEAEMHYTRALEVARRSGASGEQFVHLYTASGQALELSARYDEALARYHEFESLAQARGDQTMRFAALMARAKIHATVNPVYNPPQAQTLLEQALALAREQGDRAGEAKVLWNLMLLSIFGGGDLRQAVAYGEQSLALARELGLREQMAYTLNDIQYAYKATGQVARAVAALDEARELWRELGNFPMLADNLANISVHHFEAGNYELALACTEEAQRISQSIGNLFGQVNSRFFIGHIYLERGQVEQTIAVREEAIRLGEQVGHSPALVAARADLAWTYGILGAVERGLALARLAVASAEERFPLWRPWALGVLARLHLLRGEFDAADAAVRQGYRDLTPDGVQFLSPILVALADGEVALARQDYPRAIGVMDNLIARLHRDRNRPFALDALYLKAKAMLAQNRVDEARDVLNTARAEAEALGSRRSLWPILVALSEIEAQGGNHAEAQGLRRQAREIVEYVADHVPAELRASFLGLPHVRAIVEDES